MSMRIYHTFLGCLLGVGIMLSSCNKQLEVDSNSSSTEEVTWTSYDGVGSALTGLYSLMRTAFAEDNAYWLFGDLRLGDFTSYQRADLAAIINGRLNESYSLLDDLLDWRRYYAVIDACNVFIQNSPKALIDARYTELNNQIDVAQARAIRAYMYFYVSRIWGDVPLVTTPVNGDKLSVVGKTDKSKVLAFAQAELEAVLRYLPYQYGSNSDPVWSGTYYGYNTSQYYNFRFNRIFAYCALAHITAWKGDYSTCGVYAKYVLDNISQIGGGYISTITDLTNANGLFADRTNRNQIFSIYMGAFLNETGISGEGHIESLTLASPIISKPFPDIYLRKDTINSIFTDISDTRFLLNTSTGVYGTVYITNYTGDLPIFSKIKVLGDGSSSTNLNVFGSSIVLDRLEDIALLYAESLAALNQLSDALIYLNTVRGERGLGGITSTNRDVVISEIFKERRRELAGEGYRWYDLVRRARLLRDNTSMNALLDNNGIYWPISQTVLTNSGTAITQNSYWGNK
ncbi:MULTISPECIES: RagB/SusD family nutrient uptake outer membrane protein [Chitinophagaceae]